jgi:hypothetical protein
MEQPRRRNAPGATGGAARGALRAVVPSAQQFRQLGEVRRHAGLELLRSGTKPRLAPNHVLRTWWAVSRRVNGRDERNAFMSGPEAADPHLNLFRRFGLPFGSQEYENNITHALINTLRLSDPRITRSVLTHLVPDLAAIPVDWTDIAWGLQRPPVSPEMFQHRVALAISVDGYASSPTNETDSATSEELRTGIPDGWIYTKRSNSLCVLIEVKTRGGIDADQIRRHERSRFGPSGATLRSLDIRWKALSRAIDRAYHEHPNPVMAEFLAFLSAEGLAATLVFDDATVHFSRAANGRLPPDVTRELAERVRNALQLDSTQLVTYADWQPHVLIFTNFDAVGNIEVWLDGEPPDDVNIKTLISFGTATARPGFNRLSMPGQIEHLLQNLQDANVKARSIAAINTVNPSPVWTVLDRLQRVQMADWSGRSSEQIVQLLSSAGHPPTPQATKCFGEDHTLPGHDLDRVALGLRSLHRVGQIQGGEFNHFAIFARAYLGNLLVPAYGRSPRDVLPQVTQHCLDWQRVLRRLSGVE